MKFTEFKNGMADGKSFAVYLFEGEDAYFRERGMLLLKNKYVSEPDLNFVTLDGGFSAGELISSLEGYPFMSEKKVLVIQDTKIFKKANEEYKNFFIELIAVLSIFLLLKIRFMFFIFY